MANTPMALFDPSNRPNLPAQLGSFFDENANTQNRVTVPTLSPQGKLWTVTIDGNSTKLMKKDSEGDDVPVSTLQVVILDYNKRRGRSYYEGSFDPANPQPPVCWSADGYVPDENVPDEDRQSPRCDTCPMAVKGSRMSDNGKAVKACAEHRMLAVIPVTKNLDFTPLRLKIAVTSDYDKMSPHHEQNGWYAFSAYTEMLRSRQVQHTGMLVTKMKFDPDANYPKILFSGARWLDNDELEKVVGLVQSDEVKALVDGSWTPDGPDGTRNAKAASHATTGTAPQAQQQAPNVAPATQPAQQAQPDVQTQPAQQTQRRRRNPPQQPQQTAQQPVQSQPVASDDDDGEIILPGQPGGEAAKPVNTKAQATANQPAPPEQPAPATGAMADLLSEWGDDD